MSLFKPFFIVFALLFVLFNSSAQEAKTIPFSSDRWVVPKGTTFRVEPHLGQESVYLDGHVYLKEASLENGIIEVESPQAGRQRCATDRIHQRYRTA